jgi:S-adenosylmethionine:tRNA-ribosyltransferase-isomerase (queuine synthetase)
MKLSSRAYKKISALKSCKSESFTGLLLADKTGEIGFINLKNIGKIPVPEEVKESVEYVDQPYYKTLYGH